MKVQFFDYQIPQLALNQRSASEKKQDLSSYPCKKPSNQAMQSKYNVLLNSFQGRKVDCLCDAETSSARRLGHMLISTKNGLIARPDLAFHPSFSVSFGMLKKTKLDEYQLACANKFIAPLEKFNTNEDFNSWACKKLEEKTDLTQYKNEEPLVQDAVRKDLKEWKEYLYSDVVYRENPALSLIIFDAITKDISPDTHAFPPVLQKNVLSNTIGQLKDRIKSDPKSGFDFNKNYQNNLRLEYSKDIEDVGDGNYENHWVKVSSKIHDPEHFEENVNKLKALSCKSWCTRSTHAESYLNNGDFWVYLENNKPKLGVRFDGDKIAEIEGEKNNQKIPLNYLDTIKTFVADHGFEGAENDIKNAKNAKEQIKELHEKYSKDFENNKYDKILNELGIQTTVLDNGMLELTEFDQPYNFTFEELGLDENELFKQVEKISKTANFIYSKVTDLGNLQSIGVDATFINSKVTDLGNLHSIGEDAYFEGSKITSLANLKSIGGRAYFGNSKVTDLGNLQSIGGNAFFRNSEVTDLGNLQSIGGSAIFDNAYKVTGNVEHIGESVYSKGGEIKEKSKLPFYKPAE